MSDLAKMIRDRRIFEYMKLQTTMAMLEAASRNLRSFRHRESKLFVKIENMIREVQRELIGELDRIGKRIFHGYE